MNNSSKSNSSRGFSSTILGSSIFGNSSTNLDKFAKIIAKKINTPSSEEIIEYSDIFKKYNYKTDYVPAILMYLKSKNFDINSLDVRHIHSQLNYSSIENDILYRLYLDNPKDEKEINSLKERMKKGGYKPLDVEIACCHYTLEQQGLLSTSLSSKNLKKIVDDLKNESESENLIAIKMLVSELQTNYVKLLKIDKEFMKRIVYDRPLIALVMLTNVELNELLLSEFKYDLLKYIENEDVYKLLVPFIHIHTGKTHGQWRHLSEPSKTCIVLTTKNCKIASSKNTKKSYDKSETEGKFLVLQGLSIQADSDNAEVHYLEV